MSWQGNLRSIGRVSPGLRSGQRLLPCCKLSETNEVASVLDAWTDKARPREALESGKQLCAIRFLPDLQSEKTVCSVLTKPSINRPGEPIASQ
jgi:hypothetical protein